MPTPTTYALIRKPDHDLLIDFGIHQGGEHPYAFAVFARADRVLATESDSQPGVTDPEGGPALLRGNDLGKIWYQERPELGRYRLMVSGANGVAGLQKLASLIASLNARIRGGASFEDAVADECYALQSECVALGSTAAIRAAGVDILEQNPFPA